MAKFKIAKYGVLSLSAGLVLSACGGEETTETTDMTDDTEVTENNETTEDTTNDDMNQVDVKGIEALDFSVSLNDAVDVFYETFESENINIESIQFDEDSGRYMYSIDGWDGEFNYELNIDADTSETFEQEKEEDTDKENTINIEEIIMPKEAMDAALEASGSGYVEEWELEVENNQTIYDIDIEGGGDDQTIDALSGDAL
ncbi:MAG: PepSY domain-containing protein [Alkalibacterium sp.]|uniref:Peptidase propeptide and YPEB domain-containing protein n=1 Tax=Alkalibacterium gilvum TaxID=1130080 RepID=A0A1H6U982_9LACT|nr:MULTISPECIES: PepSY domain-containing protein [Alkalibacterium]MDN6193692.1 PepSY domain-containing protein [Alkalibacterium sp.]MDN6293325.1 PepSY domain-containing protein [Alkalibacterium sp.]MDN6294910.1 PepSY domain-containing protein [Alkalibacterium sp.]MDN6327511.1 PepSY domain-containing protein [Alkalibacterium sp.]MDN6385694.1 PepSY domain-containing protein [Alkalibacterium sp.]